MNRKRTETTRNEQETIRLDGLDENAGYSNWGTFPIKTNNKINTQNNNVAANTLGYQMAISTKKATKKVISRIR